MIVFFSALIFYFFRSNLKKKNNAEHTIALITDSLNKLAGEKYYLTKLVKASINDNDIKLSENVVAYEMADTLKLRPKKLTSLFQTHKKKMFIRYTQIGCNSCTDSTFKVIKSAKDFNDRYEVIVLVDFTSYEYYVKWKKIAEVDNKIYWVKKGDLPFKTEEDPASYIFALDRQDKTTSFFIPNSLYTTYLRNFFNKI